MCLHYFLGGGHRPYAEAGGEEAHETPIMVRYVDPGYKLYVKDTC
jgi:hypothetical protein